MEKARKAEEDLMLTNKKLELSANGGADMEMQTFLLTLREELALMKSGLSTDGFSFSKLESLVSCCFQSR